MKQAILAKISRPSYSGIFPRRRLFSILDRGRGRPLVWITASPGYGKTTLASSYIEARKLPCLWYRVDAGDSDLATFFYYMGLAARKAAPKKRSLPLLTPEYIPGLSTFTRRYFEGLFARIKVPSCVVFDNYHEVPEESLLHEVLRDGLDIIPDGVSAVIISRGGPPAQLARLMAGGLMEVISMEDLKLTEEESAGIMKLKLKGKLPKGLAEKAFNITHGWVAGLALMMEKARRGEIHDIGAADNKLIFDYLASEALDKQDKDTREFLLMTSVFPEMDSSMCERLTGLKHSEKVLSSLSRNNCFTERRFHSNPVYRYHPLFREFLLFKSKEFFNGEDLSALKRKAAVILEESGRFEDAFGLFRDSSGWDGVIGLVMKHAKELIQEGRGKMLEEWITCLPKDVLDSNPWLLYWMGLCRLPFNPSESRTYLESSFQLFKERKDAAGVFISWSGIVDTLLFGWGDFRPLDRWIEEFEDLMNSRYGFPSSEIEALAASRIFSAMVFRQPGHPDISRWKERVDSLIRVSSDAPDRMFIGYNLILYNLWMGRIKDAGVIVNILSHAFKPSKTASLPRMMWLMSKALYDFYSAYYKDGLKAVEEGIEAAERSGIHILDLLLYGQGVYNSIGLGDIELAKSFLNKMASITQEGDGFKTVFYYHEATMVAIHSGDFSLAVDNARIAFNLSQDSGFKVIENFNRYLLAYALFESGEYKEARPLIDECRRAGMGMGMGSEVFEYGCLMMETMLALFERREGDCIEHLARAFSLSKSHGLRLLFWRSSFLARLCAKALSAGVESDCVKELIRLNNLTPDASTAEVEDWPYPIKVFTLGRFSLLINGKPLVFSKKARQRPLDVLKALIALGGREVSEEQLTDALWPDAAGDAAHEALAINIHRLRGLLGHDGVLSLSNGRFTLDARYCHVDAWGFERILGKADTAIRDGHKDAAARLLERACVLYQGSFLPDDAQAPASILRERLRSKYLRYVGELGRLYEENGDERKAVDAYKRGIEADHIAEEFYQYLMVCYRKLGLRAEAIATYGRLKKTLSAALDIAPSNKTESIYKTITSE